MKKGLMTIVIALLLVTMTFALPVCAAESGKSFGKVPVSGETIKIDGEMDPIYNQALQVKIDLKNNDAATTGTTGVAYVLWNGKDTFYIYAKVTDKEVLDPAAGANAWDTDSVEVFFDYSNKAARTRDQYRVDVAGTPTYYATATVNKDKVGDYGFQAWGAKKIAGGYGVEFQIKAYKEPISAGMKIGFDLQINDMYTKDGKATRAVYHAPSSQSAKGTATKYDYLELDSATVKVPVATTAKAAATTAKAAATTATKAAQTADVGVIMSLAAASMSVGAFISFKKRK